ncbi:MAG TPA: hypothetical protein VMW26_05045 [Methanomassiliicoccales archaeon]|nr:hypothetical protein [Methanomassiliicoccales archaeon]
MRVAVAPPRCGDPRKMRERLLIYSRVSVRGIDGGLHRPQEDDDARFTIPEHWTQRKVL